MPKVPACEACNSRKAGLENYVAVVLPFGARHADAATALDAAAPRLAHHAKVAAVMRDGATPAIDLGTGGRAALTKAVPFNSGELAELAGMIARALLFHHRGVRLAPDQVASAIWASEPGDALLRERVLAMCGERIIEDIGGGALAYEGLFSPADPQTSVWRMRFFGGAIGVDENGERSDMLWAFTGRRDTIEQLTAMDARRPDE
jgi:hypothetical protein